MSRLTGEAGCAGRSLYSASTTRSPRSPCNSWTRLLASENHDGSADPLLWILNPDHAKDRAFGFELGEVHDLGGKAVYVYADRLTVGVEVYDDVTLSSAIWISSSVSP